MKFITDSEEYELEIARELEADYYLLFIVSVNSNMTFWQRFKFGLKNLFGYRCRYGQFDSLVVGEKDLHRIILRLNEK